MAIHPDLVDKLVNFQNSILGITDSSRGENLDSGLNEDESDNEDEDQKLEKRSDVPIEVKADVKMNMTNIPLVSYAPKSSKSSTLSGMETILIDEKLIKMQNVIQYQISFDEARDSVADVSCFPFFP